MYGYIPVTHRHILIYKDATVLIGFRQHRCYARRDVVFVEDRDAAERHPRPNPLHVVGYRCWHIGKALVKDLGRRMERGECRLNIDQVMPRHSAAARCQSADL